MFTHIMTEYIEALRLQPLTQCNVQGNAFHPDAAAARVLKPLTRLMHYLGHDLPAADGRASARAE